MRIYSIVLVFTCYASLAQQQDHVKPFSFIAFGDMPYFLPDDYSRFENLIRTINSQPNDFSIHVGDFKSSSTPCSNEYYASMVSYFEMFSKPLIYTPGDNEWTDCNKKGAGSYNAQERLQVIRAMFFKDSKSFGKEKMGLTSQSENPGFAKFVENRRWDFNGIQFGTLHVVGTENNKVPTDTERLKEFEERDRANLAWLSEIFKAASETGKQAVVICMQADMFNPEKGIQGFENTVSKLTELTLSFNKPVLLINGDSHQFLIDKPLLHIEDSKIKKKRVIQNFTRLQLFGEQDMHGAKIIIDPSYPGLFRIDQLLVPGN